MDKNSDILPNNSSLEKESPLLHSISKENPFSVPESYFESLPSEIIEKCRAEAKPKNWGQGILTTLLSYKWKILAITGCIASIVFFATRINDRPVSYEALAKNIPDSLIVARLDDNIANINVATLEEMQDPETNFSFRNSSDSTHADQDIIAYLIDNNINVSDIENEP